MTKGPYDLTDKEIRNMKPSRQITDENEIFKYKVAAKLRKILIDMDRAEALKKTDLHNSDLSRLICTDYSRFSLDRIIGILFKLGYTPEISVKKKRIS